MKQSAVFFEVVKYFLVMLFIYTGTSKLIGHDIFISQLSKVPLAGIYAVLISWVVPATEIIGAVLFVFPKTEITAWWIATIMLTIFTVYIAAMMSFAPLLPCSCGGIMAALSWKQHLVVNSILSILGWTKLYCHYFIRKLSMHTRE